MDFWQMISSGASRKRVLRISTKLIHLAICATAFALPKTARALFATFGQSQLAALARFLDYLRWSLHVLPHSLISGNFQRLIGSECSVRLTVGGNLFVDWSGCRIAEVSD